MAVVGVGNALNGDDAAGGLAVRLLRRRLGLRLPENSSSDQTVRWLLIDAGLAPENFTGVLRRFQPDCTLFIDAAWLGAKPGAIAGLDPELAGGFGASTHLQPLATLTGYLRAEAGGEVALLGIQPAHLEQGKPVSPPVRRACSLLAGWLAQELSTSL